METKSDIFISYRREGGEHLAARVREALQIRGFSVFMDIEDLKRGKFTTALLRKIEEASDFIVILTPGCLERCHGDRDWLRKEIAHAIRCGRNIVPVIARGFQMPDSSDLPDDISGLLEYNGISPSHELFDASMDRLVSTFLLSGKTCDPAESMEIPISEKRKKLSERLGDVDIVSVACTLIETGETGLDFVPVEKFGHMATVDPTEIEQAREMREVFSAQCAANRLMRTANIAVFAPPGSGQVFAVKQIFRSAGNTNLCFIEAELSALQDFDELIPYYRSVQDAAVQGQIPMLILRGFDSTLGGKRFGWLQHLVPTMRDGKFTDGDVRRPLGPGVLCFSGVESHSLSQIDQARRNPEHTRFLGEFLSLLACSLDMPGINPLWPDDCLHVFSRALYLRALLLRRRCRAEPALLRALVSVPLYYHQLRSLNAIIEASTPDQESGLLNDASLPSDSELNRHIDAKWLRATLRNSID